MKREDNITTKKYHYRRTEQARSMTQMVLNWQWAALYILSGRDTSTQAPPTAMLFRFLLGTSSNIVTYVSFKSLNHE